MTFGHFDAPNDPDELGDFTGLARLFPLPNVVLFPGVMLPLHIFEPRYRQMVADALESDRLITMVLSKLGDGTELQPPIFGVGCIGRIIHHEPLPDGRSNLILKGLHRVRLKSEITTDRLYRVAQVELLQEERSETSQELVDRVFAAFSDVLALVGRQADLEKITMARELPAERLCDLAAHCLQFDLEAKQALLQELNVDRRVDTLLAWIEVLSRSLQKRQTDSSGPTFSKN